MLVAEDEGHVAHVAAAAMQSEAAELVLMYSST
jgi:hypothetical protein